MIKIKKVIPAALLLTSMSGAALADNWNVGLSASIAAIDGTAKDSWRWAAAKSIEILEEEKAKFPKEQTHKMDMKNIQYFAQRDFMDALDTIGFFDIEVAEQE